MPIIPLTIQAHKLWVFVDSGAIYTLLRVDEHAALASTGKGPATDDSGW